jgi:hypothetical protein
MPTQKLTAEIISAAIEGYETQKRRIDSQIAELRQLLSTDRAEASAPSRTPAAKRKISAAGRRRMAAAQQARWAKIRGQAERPSSPAAPAPAKPKRKLSAAGRKAIIEATKKRWALIRAQKPPATGARKAAARKTGAGKRKPARKAAQAAETSAS